MQECTGKRGTVFRRLSAQYVLKLIYHYQNVPRSIRLSDRMHDSLEIEIGRWDSLHRLVPQEPARFSIGCVNGRMIAVLHPI